MKLYFLCTRNGLGTDHVHEFDANKVQGKIKSYLVTDHMAGIYLDLQGASTNVPPLINNVRAPMLLTQHAIWAAEKKLKVVPLNGQQTVSLPDGGYSLYVNHS